MTTKGPRPYVSGYITAYQDEKWEGFKEVMGEEWKRLTTIACIHVRNERCAIRIKIGDHVGMCAHVTELGEAQVGLAEAGGRCTSTCLDDVNNFAHVIAEG